MLKQGDTVLPLNTSENSIDEYCATGKEVTLVVEADDLKGTNIVINDGNSYNQNTGEKHT
jgi:hypothetical protein